MGLFDGFGGSSGIFGGGSIISQLEALKEDIESLKRQLDKAMKLVKEAGKLLGEFEGCIAGLKEKGITPDDETIRDYEYLSDFIQQLKDAKAA